ncbi:MAG: chemotaxis protein CheX [Pirellulaceae bacterium]
MTAAIRISGDWNALLEVSTTDTAARIVTEVMCGLTQEEMTEEDIKDALGEIANMIGGNVKGSLPGESKLSLPCVGNHDQFPINESSNDILIDMALDDHPFRVRLETITPVAAN